MLGGTAAALPAAGDERSGRILTDGLLDVAVVSGCLATPEPWSDELRAPVNPRNKHFAVLRPSSFTMEDGSCFLRESDGEPITGTHFEFQCCRKPVCGVGRCCIEQVK